MSLGTLRSKHQEGNKCVRILWGEMSVRGNGTGTVRGWESGQTAVHGWPEGREGCLEAPKPKDSLTKIPQGSGSPWVRAVLCLPGTGLSLISLLCPVSGWDQPVGSMTWSQCADGSRTQQLRSLVSYASCSWSILRGGCPSALANSQSVSGKCENCALQWEWCDDIGY